jgi:hypothetical protein
VELCKIYKWPGFQFPDHLPVLVSKTEATRCSERLGWQWGGLWLSLAQSGLMVRLTWLLIGAVDSIASTSPFRFLFFRVFEFPGDSAQLETLYRHIGAPYPWCPRLTIWMGE